MESRFIYQQDINVDQKLPGGEKRKPIRETLVGYTGRPQVNVGPAWGHIVGQPQHMTSHCGEGGRKGGDA